MYHQFEVPWKTDEELEKCASDPECDNKDECAKELLIRQGLYETKRRRLAENPFDPRTEVSADSKRIVQHMWIILVLLPCILGALWGIVIALSHSR